MERQQLWTLRVGRAEQHRIRSRKGLRLTPKVARQKFEAKTDCVTGDSLLGMSALERFSFTMGQNGDSLDNVMRSFSWSVS